MKFPIAFLLLSILPWLAVSAPSEACLSQSEAAGEKLPDDLLDLEPEVTCQPTSTVLQCRYDYMSTATRYDEECSKAGGKLAKVNFLVDCDAADGESFPVGLLPVENEVAYEMVRLFYRNIYVCVGEICSDDDVEQISGQSSEIADELEADALSFFNATVSCEFTLESIDVGSASGQASSSRKVSLIGISLLAMAFVAF